MDTSTFKFVYEDEEKLPAHKTGMLQACRTGDLPQLQQIYQTHNIQPGAKLDWMEKDDRPSTLFRLFITVIIHENVAILRYLLTMHPQYDLSYEIVAKAIIDHPNMEIVELLHAHQPDIVNLEFNFLQTFLTEACRGGQGHESHTSNMTLPLIHYLLDNGANPREGCFAGCGALYAALDSSQPLEIIVKMVKKGGKVNCLVFSKAMKKKRLDALEFFFEKANFDDYSINEILEDAQKSEDKEVMSVVKAGVVKLKKRQSKWWQFWK